jgi:NADH-quinone oxidoreductase subunit H
MGTGSLSLNAVVGAQHGYRWFFFVMPFTFFLFYVASIAELNRGPFDLPEAESELVAGYSTEYSGMRFGMFFLNEYAGLTIMSMVTVTLFFGGWEGPGANLLVVHGIALIPFIWFMIKVYVLVFVLVWIRLTIPRLQVDQLMGFAWKILIPLGLLNIGASGAIILWAHPWRVGMAIFQWILFLGFIGLFDPVMRWRLRRLRERLAVTA